MVRLKPFATGGCRGNRRHHQQRPARGDNRRNNQATDRRKDGKQHELLVGAQNNKALLDQLPSPRKLTHRTLLQCPETGIWPVASLGERVGAANSTSDALPRDS